MSIFATLHTAPTSSGFVHELLYITRGASAELVYPLHNKVFKAKDIDQITFTFKQGRNIYGYTMFIYIVPSMDTSVQPNKQYYKLIKDAREPYYLNVAEIAKVVNPTGNPKELGYVEESYEPNLNWTKAKHAREPRFYLFEGTEYAAIIFNLDSEDTKQFKPGIPVEYEIAIKLNTDSKASLSNKDSIIIEPQHPISVVDSLYSKL
jgi:hypothetical protein